MTKTFRKSQVEQDIGLINQERNKISISRHMVNQRELSSSSQASSLSRQWNPNNLPLILKCKMITMFNKAFYKLAPIAEESSIKMLIASM